MLDRFLGWVAEAGLEPYPAQEEALLELLAGRHVVLGTPTGSGKSLVAQGLHFQALCAGQRSFYTAPTKALVSEKFFALCDAFGAGRVAMLTGDAAINADAPIVCCTAEVLSNMALRQGEALDAPAVVMDEFHYYADPDRGVAWQVPLLVLPRTQFLLLSATLGDMSTIARRLRERSERDVCVIDSGERPVPLDFEYRETPIHETVETLLAQGRAPLYLVHFTQRDAAGQAQALTSARVASRDEKQRIAEAIEGFRFDTPYGRDVERFLRHGIGIHHAGLLPRYRLLVEQLSQQGLLKAICGTDTLGVGVNIPIRTVVFTKLSKFDGRKVGILSVREFKQIAGRAGRKGFDDQGWVVCQAPEHVVENRRREAKSDRKPRKKPPRGFVPWNRETFERLTLRPPETLESRFDVGHGMLVQVMQRAGVAGFPCGGYRQLVALVNLSHESDSTKARQRRRSAALFRSLRRAGVIRRSYDPEAGGARVSVDPELQWDFSLHQTLGLYLVEALAAHDPGQPGYVLDVLSLVESVLEDPVPMLRAQAERERRELLGRLKAAGVPYEERIRKLEEVTHPKPHAEFIYPSFDLFAEGHPWVGHENIRPKGVAREMFEGCFRFDDFVRGLGVQRSEGLLLRYLGQVLNTLVQSVPEAAKTDEVYDAATYLRTLVEGVDRSLIEEWERMLHPDRRTSADAARPRPVFDPALDPRAFRARVRNELHAIVRALSVQDYAEATRLLRADPDEPWDAARLEAALTPFHAEYERIVFEPRAREAHRTRIEQRGPYAFDVWQVLVDPADDNLWCLEGTVELSAGELPEGPLFRLKRIGT